MEPVTQRTLPVTGIANALAEKSAWSRGLTMIVETGPDEGKTIAIGARRATIGAGKECDLVLVDRAVSRVHAEAVPSKGGVLVRDLGSTNGTWMHGARVLEALIPVGGEVTIGASRLKVRDAGAPRLAPSSRSRFGGLIGESRMMREVFAVLELAAPSDVTVLLEGPSGTGKELTARAIHDHSARAAGPFVVFDCGTVSKDLVASALLGHKKGAFTGATQDRPGAFVEADKGTLFLDELGELPLECQTQLLRALETGQVFPVGGDRGRTVDVRVVAATNRDLFGMVEAGTFRLDLFHRLAVVHLRLPSLRERLDDLPAMLKGFYEGRGLPPGPIDGPNLERLRGHAWPGNVRELKNVLERSLLLSAGKTAFADLTLWLGPQLSSQDEVATPFAVDLSLPFKEAKERVVDQFEDRYLPLLMERFRDNVTHAAEHAGLSRRHLRALLVKHGLRAPGDESE